jgi:uncharacterized membrane protein YozB (DUF420 family)
MPNLSADMANAAEATKSPMQRHSVGGSRSLLAALLIAIFIVAIWYLKRFVLPYASLDRAYYDYFWPWRYALWAHLSGGVTALLIGPIQLWLGLTRQRLQFHRVLGRVYLGAVVVSLSGSAYLIFHEISSDWVFASGLLGLACAWTVTTGFAYLAIRRRRIQLHQEWMIRSYVVAFAFVFFRVFVDVAHAVGIHSSGGQGTAEELKLAAWFCWSIPLLIAEPIIQWRNLRSSHRDASVDRKVEITKTRDT